MTVLWLLAASPILLVVVLMTVVHWPAARAGLAGLAAALVVAGGWFGAGLPVQRVALIRGVLMALDVLPIVWGAYVFYRVTAEAGAIDALSEVLPVLTPHAVCRPWSSAGRSPVSCKAWAVSASPWP